MQQTGGLSVEEILESIKKVIARDNGEVAQAERHRRETEGMVLRAVPLEPDFSPIAQNDADDSPEDGPEVLELGEPLEEELGDNDDEASLEDAVETAEEETPVNDTEGTIEAAAPPIGATSSPMAPLSAISGTADSHETPLERMVREALRPMLADWIDANLPPIVERLVKAEIEQMLSKPR